MSRVLNLKKGDHCIVAIEPCSNASRRVDMSVKNIDNWTFTGTVICVSKKYITVEFNSEVSKFEIDNDYRKKVPYGTNDHKLYINKHEVYVERKKQELIHSIFGFNRTSMSPRVTNLTLDQLERIESILNEN